MQIKIKTLTEDREGLNAGSMVFEFTDALGRRFSGNTYKKGQAVGVHTVMHFGSIDPDGGPDIEDFSVAGRYCGTLNADAADLENELREALIEWAAE